MKDRIGGLGVLFAVGIFGLSYVAAVAGGPPPVKKARTPGALTAGPWKGTLDLTTGIANCGGFTIPPFTSRILLRSDSDDAGNVIETYCAKIPGTLFASIQYQSFITLASGGFRQLASCNYNRGSFVGWVTHNGDANGNGRPDCFLDVTFENTDDGDDDDGDGKIDRDVYQYNVPNNKRTIRHFDLSFPVLASEMIDFDPPTATLVETLIQPQLSEITEMHALPFIACDIDRNGVCNSIDVQLFNDALGSHPGDPNFHPAADINADDVIDSIDAELINFQIPPGDVTPPVIEGISATPAVLWPANHKMVAVTLAVSVSDDTDPNPVCTIVSVESNEPVSGPGAGGSSADWEITGALTANLRAERLGQTEGRTYTLTVECRDSAGNSSTGVVTVLVPHDQRR